MSTRSAYIVVPEKMKRIWGALPASLERAAGLLRGKRRALEAHGRRVRKEWDASRKPR